MKKINVEKDVGTLDPTSNGPTRITNIESNFKGNSKFMMAKIDMDDIVLDMRTKRMIQHSGKQLQFEPEWCDAKWEDNAKVRTSKFGYF